MEISRGQGVGSSLLVNITVHGNCHMKSMQWTENTEEQTNKLTSPMLGTV